jgi:DNA-binding transcriptional LysR family regulator
MIVADGILPLVPTLAAVSRLTEQRVPTRVQVRVQFLSGVQACFEDEHGDLMLVADYLANAHLCEEALPEMDCVLCVGKSHRLAGMSAVSLAELQDHVELSVQHASTEQQSDRHLFGCERRVYLSSFQTKLDALLLGVGFGWMPLHLVWEELRSGRLCELPYAGGSRYRFTPRLVYRSDRSLGRAGSLFVEEVRNTAWPRLTFRM